MFTRKLFVAAALLGTAGLVYSVPKSSSTASLSASDAKLKSCPVHKTALKIGTVRITYGIVGYRQGYYQASQRQFPYANSSAMGGCEVLPDSPTSQTVKFCPHCRLSEKRWVNAHKRTASKR